MQYSKKYWKWPETYVLILHSYWTPQFQHFTIPPIWLSSHSITQRYCYPCVTFSFHNFKLLPVWDLWEISNNTVLQCYLVWIFVSIRRLLQLIVCIGVSTPLSPQKHHPFFFSFLPSLVLNLQTIQAPLFSQFKLSKHPLKFPSLNS